MGVSGLSSWVDDVTVSSEGQAWGRCGAQSSILHTLAELPFGYLHMNAL